MELNFKKQHLDFKKPTLKFSPRIPYTRKALAQALKNKLS